MQAVPDTEIAQQAAAYLRLTSPEHLVNHCFRSFHWAAAVAELDRVEFDPEVLFVAAALHDLGLLEEFDRGDPFEVDGARAARDFVTERGWSDDEAAVVETAVRLHVARAIGTPDGPEAYLLWHGTGVDVAGSRVAELPATLVDEVVATYPRAGFRTGFAAMFERQASAKPRSRAAELVSHGLLERLAGCVLDQPSPG